MRPRLLVAFSLAVIIVLAQAVGSLVTGSLALLTDTAHAITDASGLLVALTAASLMTRPATSRHTWGFRRIEVLAALGQSVLLLAVGIYAAVEGVHRLFAAPEVPGAELLVLVWSVWWRMLLALWCWLRAEMRTSICVPHSWRCSMMPWVRWA